MKLTTSTIFATLTFLASSALATSHTSNRQQSLDDWLEEQEKIAIQGILDNIGPNGSKVAGAASGVVVASPSKSDPDYFYTWTRDSALAMKALVTYKRPTNIPGLFDIIASYVNAQEIILATDNPSAGTTTGGLGEPKFHVNRTAFTDDWGRPQHDGPALRASTLVEIGKYCSGNSQLDCDSWYNNSQVIAAYDINYIATYWNETGFDLWEEVEGTSYFTLAAQQKALADTEKWKSYDYYQCPTCSEAKDKIHELMGQLWNDEGHITTDVNLVNENDRSGKGAATILAANLREPEAEAAGECKDFHPCDPRALANLKAVADSMRPWQINSGKTKAQAPAIGRYAEDEYYDGNPWYITTLAAAEQLYHALRSWHDNGRVIVTDVSLPFWLDLNPDVEAKIYTRYSDPKRYNALISAAADMADGYLEIVRKYTPEDGSMAEQFSKTDGTPLSAEDLTWSYAALLEAKKARDGSYGRLK